MSHKVTYTTKMNNLDLLKKALDSLSLAYKLNKGLLEVGSRKPFTIDPATGSITGDSDYIHKDLLDKISQSYSEQEFLAKAYEQGASIESRQVVDGNIEIYCRLYG